MLEILRLGLKTEDTSVLRMCACVVLNFAFFNRADTGVQLCREDVGIEDADAFPAVSPAPAIHAILTQVKAGDTVHQGANYQKHTKMHSQVLKTL